MRVLAVGDIHTKLWIIDKVEEILDNYDTIVFVGDYADDWKSSPIDSIATWQRLKELQDKNPDKVKLVSGNHDYIYAHVTPSKQSGYRYETQLLIGSPENKELKDWLQDLPITLEVDNVLYSHAGVVEEWGGSDLWTDNSPLWARPTNTSLTYKISPQVFGHTPSKTCHRITEDIWCIDSFSTYPDGSPVGDNTVLEITDGRQFRKVKLDEQFKRVSQEER